MHSAGSSLFPEIRRLAGGLSTKARRLSSPKAIQRLSASYPLPWGPLPMGEDSLAIACGELAHREQSEPFLAENAGSFYLRLSPWRNQRMASVHGASTGHLRGTPASSSDMSRGRTVYGRHPLAPPWAQAQVE